MSFSRVQHFNIKRVCSKSDVAVNKQTQGAEKFCRAVCIIICLLPDCLRQWGRRPEQLALSRMQLAVGERGKKRHDDGRQVDFLCAEKSKSSSIPWRETRAKLSKPLCGRFWQNRREIIHQSNLSARRGMVSDRSPRAERWRLVLVAFRITSLAAGWVRKKNEACPSNGNFAPECMRMSRKVTNLRGKQKAASSLCRPDGGAAGSRSAQNEETLI